MSERLRPINDDDMLIVDTTNGDILGIQPRHKPDDRASFGGGGIGGGTVQDGLYVVEIGGQTFALVPVVGGAVEANFVPRKGTLAQLATIAGEPGEIAAITDQPGFALLNGVSGGAKFIMADTAGRTLTVRVPTLGYAEGTTIPVGPEVQQIVVLWDTPPADRYDESNFVVVPLVFSGQRDPQRPLRVITEMTVTVGSGDSGVTFPALGTLGDRVVADYVLVDDAYILASQLGTDGQTGGDLQGAVRIGAAAGATADYALAIGGTALADQPGMVSFGRPAYSVFANRYMLRIGGQTTGANGTAVLLPNPSAAASEKNSVRLNGIVGSTTFSARLDIIGRTNTNYARFVRDVLIHRSSAGALTLLTPDTPNNPSDILSAGAAGAAVALSVDSTLNALQVQVTGPTASTTMRWSCMIDIHAAAGL